MGVNVVYAPVCDLATNPANPHIGIRSFGDEPGRRRPGWPRRSSAGCGGSGSRPAVKHFPGLGELGPRHAPRAGGGRARPGEARRAPSWCRSAAAIEAGRRGRDVGAPRAARRSPATPTLPATLSRDGDARPDPRRPRVPRRSRSRDALDMGALAAGRRPGDRRHRGHPRGRRPAAVDGAIRTAQARIEGGLRHAAARGLFDADDMRASAARIARAPAAAGRGRAAADSRSSAPPPTRRSRGRSRSARSRSSATTPGCCRSACAADARVARRACPRRATSRRRTRRRTSPPLLAAAIRRRHPRVEEIVVQAGADFAADPGGDRGCGHARARHRQRLAWIPRRPRTPARCSSSASPP